MKTRAAPFRSWLGAGWVGLVAMAACSAGPAGLPDGALDGGPPPPDSPTGDAGRDPARDLPADVADADGARPDGGSPEPGWCQAVAGGPAGARDFPVDLSAAHAGVRYFAPEASRHTADAALQAALTAAGTEGDPGEVVRAYAAALPTVCFRSALGSGLPAATVELRDDVAFVRPGTGPLQLPAGARAVVLDLRELPFDPGLEALLDTVAPLLAGELARPSRQVRFHIGSVDEVFFPGGGIYTVSAGPLARPPLVGSAGRELPLILHVAGPLPGPAAELAGTLRLAGKAWLFGDDLSTEVAESRWQGVGEAGLAYRYQDLLLASGERWPDVVGADRPALDPADVQGELAGLGAPPAPAAKGAARPAVAVVDEFGEQLPGEPGPAVARTGLLIAHGMARLFFPYFPDIGDTIDDRLMETWASAAQVTTRADLRNVYRRFGHALFDSHQYVSDLVDPGVGVIPAAFQEIDGLPTVLRSTATELVPGDTVTSVDGQPAAEWLATELLRTGGATHGHQFDVAMSELTTLTGPRQLGLRDPDGTERTVTLEPRPFSTLTPIGYAYSQRQAGFLDDLGAPGLYYINLDGRVAGNTTAMTQALTEAATSATGLVLDLRGHPAGYDNNEYDPYQLLQRLIADPFDTPRYRIPRQDGPDVADWAPTPFEATFNPLTGLAFAGPLVLLIDQRAVSFAEDFGMMLLGSTRAVTVVGRTSAGTTGSITGIQLPGDMVFSITGMEARWPDGSRLFALGITPDHEVQPTAADLRAGRDADLERAIELLLP